ncbi:MAG: type VI secretion system lipoprotein TssJ [Rhodoferax sp.]|nr:type VI secretion system lipoprotein TssJ [Rhodoferax sp.]
MNAISWAGAVRGGGYGRSVSRVLVWASVLVAALTLVACASKPVVSQVKLSIAAGADVNPDARNRPSPITVRVYALKSAATFEAADFFSLFEKDATVLGADVVAREELLMRPGDSKPLEMKLPPEAKALAVFAAYRDLDRARWRAVRMIEVGKEVNLQIKVTARQITIE